MKRVALQTTQKTEEGYMANQLSKELIGKTGVAHTTLRPSGKVLIDGDVYDAYSRGEFIEQGTEIVVIEEGVNSLKVRPV